MEKQETNEENLWSMEPEGQLSIDILENDEMLVIISAIAGVKPEDLDVTVTSDTVTIRGTRQHKIDLAQTTAHLAECYWGRFSRSIVLPHPVNPEEVDAALQNGVLTIMLKKNDGQVHVPVADLD